VQVVLQNKASARYWDGEKWVHSIEQAVAFESVLQALNYCRKQRLPDANVILLPQHHWRQKAVPPPAESAANSDGVFREFRLYLASGTLRCQGLENVLRDFCQKFLKPELFTLEVFDLRRDPDRFIADSIAATPTLVLKSGSARRTLVGTFTAVDLFRFVFLHSAHASRLATSGRHSTLTKHVETARPG
jgi:hypothetical protein